MQGVANENLWETVGQLKLVGRDSAFTSQANASIPLSCHPRAKKYAAH